MATPSPLDFKSVGREVAAIYVADLRVILPLAAGIFLLPAIFNHLPLPPLLVFPLAYPIQTSAFMVYAGIVAQRRSTESGGDEVVRAPGISNAIAPRIAPLVLAGIIVGLGTVAGLLCFVLPGVFLATMWFVVAPVIAVEDQGWKGGLRSSWRLIRPRFGRVLIIAVAANILTYGIWWLVVPSASELGRLGGMVGSELTYVLVSPVVAVIIWCVYARLRGITTAPGRSAAPRAA